MPYLANLGMVFGHRINQSIFLIIVITMPVILPSRTKEKSFKQRACIPPSSCGEHVRKVIPRILPKYVVGKPPSRVNMIFPRNHA